MQWSPLRLVQKRWKALYIVGGFIATVPLFVLLAAIPSMIVGATLATILQSAWILYGVRIFRGPEEVLITPRPWWRMTARPRAGFLLGAVFLYGAVGQLFPLGLKGPPIATDPVYAVSGIIEFGALAVLYFASSVRLVRQSKLATRTPAT